MNAGSIYTGPIDPELIEGIKAVLPETATQLEVARIARAAQTLYEACGELSICDSAGGAESIRVIPEVVKTLRLEANLLPQETVEQAAARFGIA
jgi:hypothetical protein